MNDNSSYQTIESITLDDYAQRADLFWLRTKDHDVSQNYEAFLSAMPDKKGLDILDFGCGPGRDLHYFSQQGHHPVGLDGCKPFCEQAREYSGCEVIEQSFFSLNLEAGLFDGIFANASLFHVPGAELPRVLEEFKKALRPGGILFTSSPRGNSEGWSGNRYGCFMELKEYQEYLSRAGFSVLSHYYRPKDKPRAEQPWLAVVSKKACL
ncbi:MAG: methyltransferase domain-containing protein [Pseudomonadales bacterium]|nr:methyltransferase domain-containing protein [Pseudomonadales bacterium]